MNRFKKSLLVCCIALGMFLPVAFPTSSEATITITIWFGQPRSCEGWGLCRIEIGFQAAETPKPGERREGRRKCRAAAVVRDNKLFIDMETTPPDRNAAVPINENMALDGPVAKALGFKSVTLLRGEYKIDYSRNKGGSMVINVQAQ